MYFNGSDQWEEFKEPIPNFEDTSLKSDTLLEHTDTTKDTSDYLWYSFRYKNSIILTYPGAKFYLNNINLKQRIDWLVDSKYCIVQLSA